MTSWYNWEQERKNTRRNGIRTNPTITGMSKSWGTGNRLDKTLHERGYKTCGDIKNYEREVGGAGERLRHINDRGNARQNK